MLILTTSAFTQTNQTVSSNKIAIIDTSVFNDREGGIKILIQAEQSYNIEYYEKHSLMEKIDKLEKDINYLIRENQSINEKYIELQKLQAEFKLVKESKKADHNKKYSIFVSPVIEKISKKIKEFSKLKGYAIVIDKFESSILFESGTDDITSEFIKFCNDSFDKEKLQ